MNVCSLAAPTIVGLEDHDNSGTLLALFMGFGWSIRKIGKNEVYSKEKRVNKFTFKNAKFNINRVKREALCLCVGKCYIKSFFFLFSSKACYVVYKMIGQCNNISLENVSSSVVLCMTDWWFKNMFRFCVLVYSEKTEMRTHTKVGRSSDHLFSIFKKIHNVLQKQRMEFYWNDLIRFKFKHTFCSRLFTIYTRYHSPLWIEN